ncbi:MAG: transporter substrate-binding domain-containing protein [Clostridia bacterium]|nr:transporter substrate-binding domain-containing protein [Clostridia bacterium]
MKKSNRIMTIVLAVILIATSLFAFAGCGKPYYSVRYQAIAIEGIPKTEYVMCVSKAVPDGQEILNALNKVIKEEAAAIVESNISPTGRGGFAKSANEKNKTMSEDTAVIFYIQLYDPFTCAPLGGGEYGVGIDVDIAYKVAHSLDRRASFMYGPIDFSMNRVKDGHAHVLAQAIPYSKELEKDFYVSEVYATGSQSILSNSRQKFDELADLGGLVIGVIEGRPGQKLVEDAVANGVLKDTGAVIRYYDTDTEVKNAFLQNNIDVAVLDEFPAKITAQYLGTKYIFR